jgi:hypothetical protein
MWCASANSDWDPRRPIRLLNPSAVSGDCSQFCSRNPERKGRRVLEPPGQSRILLDTTREARSWLFWTLRPYGRHWPQYRSATQPRWRSVCPSRSTRWQASWMMVSRRGRHQKPAWVVRMAARQRKTLVVCWHCHHRVIHAGDPARRRYRTGASGEPDAVKVARPVRRGVVGKGLATATP